MAPRQGGAAGRVGEPPDHHTRCHYSSGGAALPRLSPGLIITIHARRPASWGRITYRLAVGEMPIETPTKGRGGCSRMTVSPTANTGQRNRCVSQCLSSCPGSFALLSLSPRLSALLPARKTAHLFADSHCPLLHLLRPRIFRYGPHPGDLHHVPPPHRMWVVTVLFCKMMGLRHDWS